MASRKSISRELVADVIKRLMIEIEDPSLAVSTAALTDPDAESTDIEAYINGLTAATPLAIESAPAALVVEYTSGTKPVSLRIPCRVIKAFRAGSKKTGTSYQTLMIRALSDAADGLAL